METEAIESLKLQFREHTGLDANENAADFSGWLFLQRQKAIRDIISDLNERSQHQPVTVSLLKSVMNKLLMY